jgi:hypothetical protein
LPAGSSHQGPRRRRRQQPQPEVHARLLDQAFHQRQSPAHPALVAAQQLGRLDLVEAILTHQGMNHPGFLQRLHGPATPVEPVDGRLGGTLISRQQLRRQAAQGR